MVRLRAPLPTPLYLCQCLAQLIATHPLIVNQLVGDLDGNPVPILKYKLFPGLHYEEGLMCSIYPYYTDGHISHPTNANPRLAATYSPYTLGDHEDHATYYILVTLQHNSLMAPIDDGRTITVPLYAPLNHPVLLTPSSTNELPLIVNPSLSVLSDYIELIRLVVSDPVSKQYIPFRVNSLEVIHADLKLGRWEQHKNIYFHEADILVRLDAYISRGWRDRLLRPVDGITLSTNGTITTPVP